MLFDHNLSLILSLQLRSPASFALTEKNQDRCIEAKRALIEPGHPELSIAQQCELLGLARSSYYYEPVPESEENLLLMRLLDEQYTRIPFYGTRKMTAWLHTQGYVVDRKRVRRLLRLMNLETVYPKPRLECAGTDTSSGIRTYSEV